MNYGIRVALLMFLVGCSARPTPQEVLLRSDGRTIVNGAPATDGQLHDLAIAKHRRQGAFLLTVRADADVPLWRLAHIADIFRAAGVWKIDTGSSQPEARPLLYPTFHTWTNEWKWHGLFVESDSITAIKTNAGVNVRLLADGARIEDSPVTMPALLDYLVSLAGGERARLVITSETNAPHGSLMSVLATCEKHGIDPLFVEQREAEQGAAPLPSAPQTGPSEGAR